MALYKTLFFELLFSPLTPKIYSPKFSLAQNHLKSACMIDRPEMFAPTRGFSEMADSMESCTMLCGRPLLPWQRNLGKFGLFFRKKSPIGRLICQIDYIMFGPTRGDDQRAIFVAISTTFTLGAESNRLPACYYLSQFHFPLSPIWRCAPCIMYDRNRCNRINQSINESISSVILKKLLIRSDHLPPNGHTTLDQRCFFNEIWLRRRRRIHNVVSTSILRRRVYGGISTSNGRSIHVDHSTLKYRRVLDVV